MIIRRQGRPPSRGGSSGSFFLGRHLGTVVAVASRGVIVIGTGR